MFDRTVKQSLVTYDMRPAHLVDAEPALGQGRDADDRLLSVVQHQLGVVEQKVRLGAMRQAITSLHRAYGIAASAAPAEGPVPPVVHLAVALVRLQLCVVLSKVGQHREAAHEARAAQFETDELWRTLQEGVVEAEAFALTGSSTGSRLTRLIHKPPLWLARAVEASIQARQCLALELEFAVTVARQQGYLGRQAANSVDDTSGGGMGSESPAQMEEEIEKHHNAALKLAEDLLPEGNTVRQRAEKVHSDALKRREVGQYASPKSLDGKRKELSVEGGDSAGEDGLLRPPGATTPTGSQSELLRSRSSESMTSATPSSQGMARSHSTSKVSSGTGRGEHRKASRVSVEAGDLFASSLPRNSPTKESKKKIELKLEPAPQEEEQPSKISKARRSVLGVAGANRMALATPDRKRIDPFEDWKRNVVDINRMTLKQHKLHTEDGIRDLHDTLKLENRRFKQVDLKCLALDPDRLYENRTLYTHHGLNSLRKVEERHSVGKKAPPTDNEDKQQRTRELFAWYGVNAGAAKPGEQPNVKNLKKLLHESIVRNPYGKELRALEEKQRLSGLAVEFGMDIIGEQFNQGKVENEAKVKTEAELRDETKATKAKADAEARAKAAEELVHPVAEQFRERRSQVELFARAH